MLSKIDFKSRTLFSTLKNTCQVRLPQNLHSIQHAQKTHISNELISSLAFISAHLENAYVIYIYIYMIDSRNRDSQKTYMPNEIDFRTRTLFGTHRKRICRMRLTTTLVLYSALTKGTCQVRLTTSLVLYSAQTQNAHV